jgi:hypothetical protein
MAAHRFVAVVGARMLPESAAPQVAAVVQFLLSRGWGIGSGGAGARMRLNEALEAVHGLAVTETVTHRACRGATGRNLPLRWPSGRAGVSR